MARARDKFHEVLRRKQEDGKLVCIFHGEDGSDKFDVGFVESLTASTVTLLAVSPRGDFDGRIVMNLEDLNRIETDDRYSKKIELLNHYRESVFKPDDKVDISARQSAPIDHLKKAQAENSVVCVEDQSGNTVTGFVAEIGDDYVEIEMLSQNGDPDGRAVVHIGNMARMQVGSREQQVRSFLYRYHYELKRMLSD
jgi:pimeloyl-CoA synthetase